MKIKWTWAVFAPLFLVMIGLKVYQAFYMGPTDIFLGMNRVQVAYLGVLIAAVMFLICAVINIADKKTADVMLQSRNIFSGILALACAGTVIATSGYDMLTMLNEGRYAMLWLINAVCGILAAIGFVFTAVAMFRGKNKSRGMSLVFLLPAVWSATLLIATFSEDTWLSVRTNDMTVIVAYVFMTLFFFYQAAVLAVFNDKNAVKKNFVFGLPAIGLLAICGIASFSVILADPNALKFENMLLTFQLFLFALYILNVLVFMTGHLADKDKLETVSNADPELEKNISDSVQNSYRDLADKLEKEENAAFTLSPTSEEEIEFSELTAEELTAEAVPEVSEDDSDSALEDIEALYDSSDDDGGFSEATQLLNKLLEDFNN